MNIINDVSFKFESGNIYGISGINGSGKTVLLKLICGFYKPTKGVILKNKVNYIEKDLFLDDANALIEKPSFVSFLTGFENLKYLADIKKIATEEDIIEVLKKVNLYKEKDKIYKEYSLGMKQKLGLAQVFMENPSILIFDEPFNGIEIKTADKLREELKKLSKEGKLIIIASHIKEDIKNLVDISLEMEDGKLLIK